MAANTSATQEFGLRKAIVIFDSRYGNTQRIATSLEAGLKETNLQTVCLNAKDVDMNSLKQYDLICIGAPTEMFTASKSIKNFLNELNKVDLSGKFGFAFDTKLPSSLSGSASKFIENKLKDFRLEIVIPRISAIVIKLKGAPGDVVLNEGEEKRLELIGRQIGAILAGKGKIISA